MDLGLDGRACFITGGNRGLGAAIAEGFAEEGANLALFCRDLEAGRRVAADLARRHDVRTVAVALELTRPEEFAPAVQSAMEALGGVDILVNNAGGAPRLREESVASADILQALPDAYWEEYLAVKPLGYVRMIREVLPHLRASSQARIINMGGVRGKEPHQKVGGRSMIASPANMSILGLTKSLANRLGPEDITVNAVAPGRTRTRRYDELVELTMMDEGLDRAGAEEFVMQEVPLGRPAEPGDVADVVLFLASRRARNITGIVVNVDSGSSRGI